LLILSKIQIIMEELFVAKVDYEEAKKLADLGAIIQDLEFTMKTCSRLNEVLEEQAKDLRNKHIAHSVNPFEQMEVGLVLSPQKIQERKIIGVGILSMRQISFDIEGVHHLGLLANVLRGKVREMAKQYEEKVLEKGKDISIDVLYKCARPRMIAPGPELTDKARS